MTNQMVFKDVLLEGWDGFDNGNHCIPGKNVTFLDGSRGCVIISEDITCAYNKPLETVNEEDMGEALLGMANGVEYLSNLLSEKDLFEVRIVKERYEKYNNPDAILETGEICDQCNSTLVAEFMNTPEGWKQITLGNCPNEAMHLKVGDIVTFTSKEKHYMSQKVTVVTKINENRCVLTEGNIKATQVEDIILICSKKDRKDI